MAINQVHSNMEMSCTDDGWNESPLSRREPESSPWPIIVDEDRAAVMRVLDRGVLSGMFAPEARALEQEFAAFAGARHCLLTHSGTSALQLALAAAGVEEGDEVIVPAYSFVATPMAVLLQRAVPVFADVDVATGLLDPACAEAAISPRTRAIMPVHVHGCPADLEDFGRLARKRGLAIVEDAAQAHGATFNGRHVGAIGTSGGFSLQTSKSLPGGEGGLFVTNDDSGFEIAQRLRSFGQKVEGKFNPQLPLDSERTIDVDRIGAMYRGNEMMAAFVRSQLRRFPALLARCQDNAERLITSLRLLPGVHPPLVPAGRTSGHHKFRVRVDAREAGLDIPNQVLRDQFAAALRAEGLSVVTWQSSALPAFTLFGNQEPARFPATSAMLDSSFVLFSQSSPLIAQSRDAVDHYAATFERVWAATLLRLSRADRSVVVGADAAGG
jgi:dTDP-4-amino-4,6-dideoxygalactose transaminase